MVKKAKILEFKYGEIINFMKKKVVAQVRCRFGTGSVKLRVFARI